MRVILRLAFAALLLAPLVSVSLAADQKPHRVAIQLDQNDPQVMNLALNNATNVIEHYRARNEEVELDIVTWGPGLHMLRDDTSPVKDRLKRLKELAVRGKVQLSACNYRIQGW